MSGPFVIYRIIGNALPPRHDPEHTLRNLAFILEREPELPGCEKRWLLNRFVDRQVQERCLALIEGAGQRHHVIPFDADGFRATFYDASGLPPEFAPFTARRLQGGDVRLPVKAYEWMLRHKSLRLIDLNAARNVAVELGRATATWTLPLDGWSFLTSRAWEEIAAGLLGAHEALYGIVPLARLDDNGQLDDPARLPRPDDEPQVAFHRDAPDRFDELLRYGNLNKAELLMRLGVPGPWQRWTSAPWDTTRRLEAVAPGRFVTCGRVYRLASGASREVETSSASRHLARYRGVSRLARSIDRRLLVEALENGNAGNHASLAADATWPGPRALEALRRAAEAAAAAPMPSITAKAALAPGGDRRDYISASRYHRVVDGRIEHRDGEVAPAAMIGSPESRAGDRTALWECMRHAVLFTASGVLDGRREHLGAARALLLHWFADPETAMNPHARFAQFYPRRGTEAVPAGWIDLRDLWMLPGLCRSLRGSGALSQAEHGAIAGWAGRLVEELDGGRQGRAAYWTTNNLGTWVHLLKLSLAVFAGRIDLACDLLESATLRLACQCGAGGMQANELARARPLHYAMFNLTGWVLLAGLCRSLGVDLWRYRGIEGQSICRMIDHALRHAPHLAALETPGRDWQRWFHALLLLVPGDAADRGLLPARRLDPDCPWPDAPWRDDPDRGLPPQWWFYLLRPGA